ncbi:ferritin-like fold-containing protein [Cellulomonas marina]|uniref:tRNA-(MS[2]IO[6]A)-hydroxylase (MiaE)-like n=1 Tax=Cellulomonas marina TaxID=988821 RepID=A0A1I1A1V3_9CELL|nr:ferritin-like fold-containing protein [Cellulomonas marina]GIG30484.1 hypothetical protein Cma02nite_30840 [Cellulomonas marina]SFB31955.1 tRNA-(MS[2]IO[6]A)-hydroxylase (MiaE)-like [Cellulomonas marina]
MTSTPRRPDTATSRAATTAAADPDARAAGRPGAGAPTDDGCSAADAIALLGLVAELEHESFARLAADAAVAPSLEQSLQLSRLAVEAVARRDRVLTRVTELGGDPVDAMRPYEHMLDDFDARTTPSSWWERLLKVYVGYGVADDFCRLAAAGLDERSRELVLEVLQDASHAELAVAELDAAGAGNDVLAARLALWGRRLVGEALGTVQRLVVEHPTLARLIAERPGARTATGRTGRDATAPGVPVVAAPAAPLAVASPVAASVAAPESGGHGRRFGLHRRRPAAVPVPASVDPATAEATAGIFGELTAEHTRRMTRLGLTA